MRSSGWTKLLMVLTTVQAISAIPSGFALIIDTSGGLLGLPSAFLSESPFNSFLWPGLVLFFDLGIFPLLVLYGLIKRPKTAAFDGICILSNHHWALSFSIYLGAILIFWIQVQFLFKIPFSFLHFAYSLLGLLLIIIPLSPAVRQDFIRKDDPFQQKQNSE